MKRFMYIIHIVSETIPTAEKKLLDLLFLGVISLRTTILGKIFAYFFTFYKTFPSSQLKRDQIIFTREWMYELPQELPRTFSPMGGPECQGSYRRWAGLSTHTRKTKEFGREIRKYWENSWRPSNWLPVLSRPTEGQILTVVLY